MKYWTSRKGATCHACQTAKILGLPIDGFDNEDSINGEDAMWNDFNWLQSFKHEHEKTSKTFYLHRQSY